MLIAEAIVKVYDQIFLGNESDSPVFRILVELLSCHDGWRLSNSNVQCAGRESS